MPTSSISRAVSAVIILGTLTASAGVTSAQPTSTPTTAAATASATATTQPAVVTAVPESVFLKYNERDREAARAFYGKHVDVGGLSILAHGSVDDAALIRTHDIVGHMLAGRPDVLEVMQKANTHLIIIGKDQVYTDMPEYRNNRDPAFVNERVRGTGGLDVTSFGEENLLNLLIDRYDDESIAVHEFLHTIDAALGRIDQTWRGRLRDTFQNAKAKGRWNKAYAGGNAGEYWAEIAQSYLGCNRVNNWNHAGVASREQLKTYDPEGYELVRSTLRLNASNDWRFTPLQIQPSVIAPPAKFKVDPYYTKFTYARELPVIASAKVSDEALLKANDTVRKLFAYRHDVLKVLINDGGRLVILGRDEKLSDLPQLHSTASTQPVFDDARYMDYSPEAKIVVVPEENILSLPGEPLDGASGVVRAMSRAAYIMTASRAVDPNWDKRSQQIVQQYEMRVSRLDSNFGDRVKALFTKANEAGLWKGTSASNDPLSYWSAGVEAYFDAAGKGEPPVGTMRPIATREALKAYDPEFYELVNETFAYYERIDWRFSK